MKQHTAIYTMLNIICALVLIFGSYPVYAVAETNSKDTPETTTFTPTTISTNDASENITSDAPVTDLVLEENAGDETVPNDVNINTDASSETPAPTSTDNNYIPLTADTISENTPLTVGTISEVSDGQLSTENDLGSIILTYKKSANLPANSEVTINEISPDDKRFKNYVQTIAESDDNIVSAEQINARIFDITIISNGSKTEPADTVDVELTLNDSSVLTNDTNIVHFADETSQPETLNAEINNDTISFTTNAFSAFCVYHINDWGDTESLDGQSYLIANWNPNKDYMGVITNVPKSTGLALTKAWMNAQELVYAETSYDPATFTFHKVTEPDPSIGVTEAIFNNPDNADILYTISTVINGETKWLNMQGVNLTITDTPTPFRIITNVEGYDNQIMVKAAAGSRYPNHRLNMNSGKIENHVEGTTYATLNQNDYFTLIDARKSNAQVLESNHFANKISVSYLEDGDEVVIYRSVWNEGLNKYVQLAINGYGKLVQVTDEGGYVGWYDRNDDSGNEEKSVRWKLTIGQNIDGTPSGYYWFQNVDTGAFLSPKALFDYDGNIINELVFPNIDNDGNEILPGEANSFDYSVQMPEREKGEFTSRIITWSQQGGTEGIYYLEDPDALYKWSVHHGNYGDAEKLNYARIEDYSELETKRTIDNIALGINITLFDYPSMEWQNEIIGNNQLSNVNDKNRNNFVAGLVERKLENGVPVSTSNGNSLEPLFTNGTSANHLFLQSIYGETGYYEYDSENNYAYYNQDTGDFTVYNQIGSPQCSSARERQHGHFMPYNPLSTQIWNEKNILTKFLEELSVADPRYGNDIHKAVKNPGESDFNYNFGMTIESNFNQVAHDRYGNDIIFEFAGDDDLWLFVDDVLVLDIGGIHGASGGSVNFTTGEISHNGFTASNTSGGTNPAPVIAHTIKEAFQLAGVFPDGTPWTNDATQADVDKYFSGNTFKEDYFYHTMKMFFMERGKNASNLSVRFNTQSVPNNMFLVTKNIPNIKTQSFIDNKFAFQAFLKDGTPLTSAVKANKTINNNWELTDTPIDFQSIEIGGHSFDNVFFLGHDEGAYFDIRDTDEYYIQEINLGKNIIQDVFVNGVQASYDADENQPSLVDNEYDSNIMHCVSTTEKASHRRLVAFENDFESNDLRVTKKLNLLPEQHVNQNDEFQFKVKLGPNAENLSDYSVLPYYLIKQVEGQDVYYYRINSKIVELQQGIDGIYYYDNNGTLTPIPTKNPTDPVFDYSSQTGYIDHVPAGYTLLIKALPPGITFEVVETNLPSGYTLDSITDANPTSFTPVSDAPENGIRGNTIPNTDAEVDVTNNYEDEKIHLRKISADDPTKYLEGAVFKMYNNAPSRYQGETVFYNSDLVMTLRSDSAGFLRTTEAYYGGEAGSVNLELPADTYYLVETQAPSGYKRGKNPIAFTINNDNSVTILGSVQWDKLTNDFIIIDNGEMQNGPNTTVDNIELVTGYITNKEGIEIPLTGMNDIQTLIVLALELIALGGLIYTSTTLHAIRKRIENKKLLK